MSRSKINQEIKEQIDNISCYKIGATLVCDNQSNTLIERYINNTVKEAEYKEIKNDMIDIICHTVSGTYVVPVVERIGGCAFYNSPNLKKVIISDGVKTIGNSAFESCSGLVDITIPDSVTVIERKAFVVCTNLPSIDIPSSVKSIGKEAFQYCRNLQTVICRAVTPPVLNTNAFSSTSLKVVYVPDESIAAYKTATNWVIYADKIKPLSSYTE